jgi:hypothetical protein
MKAWYARDIRGGRFKARTNMCFKPARTPGTPKIYRKWGPRAPGYRRSVLRNHWISKSGWGTGWAPSGCPSQNAFSSKMPPREPPRICVPNHGSSKNGRAHRNSIVDDGPTAGSHFTSLHNSAMIHASKHVPKNAKAKNLDRSARSQDNSHCPPR